MARAPALVLFDLDGVLVHYDRQARIDHLAACSGTSGRAVREALFGSGLEDESDRGLWPPAAYAQELSRRLGAPLTLADCIAARAAATRADRAMLALARAIARRARIGILTNNGPFLTRHLAAICPPLLPLFAGAVHGSGELGAAKPDPAAYQRCLAACGVAPASALFIDDNAGNVAGARSAGLDALRFSDIMALRQALADRHLPGIADHAP